MPLHQSRSHSSSENEGSFRLPKRLQRKLSTTCVPDILAPKDQQRRVTVLGAGNTGKSAIITQFLYERFPNGYKKTVDEIHRAEYEVSGQNLTLEILDTSGYYQFPAMRELAIRKSDAFILVFSVDNEASLEEMKLIREEILRIKNDDHHHTAYGEREEGSAVKVPMVVVANKTDLEENLWKIDRAYVECLVKCDWESCGYVEASAKDNIGVVEIFKELLVQSNIRYALSPAIKKRRESMPNVFTALPRNFDALQQCKEMILHENAAAVSLSRMGSAASSRERLSGHGRNEKKLKTYDCVESHQ
ncbi:putative GTP-binding protein Rhes [Hypsibius exemplaris]|uniref:GTP-binding protein Rhes n=1 Tax=Hypsibius exemplaris TaxID=2072580 RepID=A0A9X6NCD3_HYPEX|nr:putative GTP-binding protein Rhes [Hypsibius exemplaris]